MRWIHVWRRNFLVWRKLFIASVLTNLADPLILLFGLGYGLGALLPSVEGMSYIAFFAAGTLASATMFTASFESMFSGFSRMHGQKTWDAILYAPLTIDAFVAVGLIMTVLARNWDFFSFYMTLIMTPMTMISGVFFPAEQLPRPVHAVAQALPLYHGVALVRPLVAGDAPRHVLIHLAVLLAYAAAGYAVALYFAR